MNQPVHVLVVDDDGASRDEVCAQIRRMGFRCECVITATDAMAVLDWWLPLIVIVEWNLTDGSAVGLSPRIRGWADDRYRPLLLLAHSATPPATTERFDRYFAKPVTYALLDDCIGRFLVT